MYNEYYILFPVFADRHALSKSVFTVRSDHSASSRRTVVISGGGAGHEPAHASYTGRGMLSAAVSGDIFASPSASQILTCIDLALHNSSGAESQPKEVLLIVNNYTGDRLNFGLAAEKARSKGICVETVLVADDVAVGRDRGGRVGRRGLAGNILVCKILGAAAERGVALNLLVELGNAITKNLASIAVSLDHCHVPGRDKDPMKWDKLPESSCELGMGLHNEPGARRLEQRPEPEELVSQMLNFIINDKDQDRSYVKFSKGDQVIVFVNNQGGISQLELGAAVDEITKQLG
jgi:dihydroxyacetone kinase